MASPVNIRLAGQNFYVPLAPELKILNGANQQDNYDLHFNSEARLLCSDSRSFPGPISATRVVLPSLTHANIWYRKQYCSIQSDKRRWVEKTCSQRPGKSNLDLISVSLVDDPRAAISTYREFETAKDAAARSGALLTVDHIDSFDRYSGGFWVAAEPHRWLTPSGEPFTFRCSKHKWNKDIVACATSYESDGVRIGYQFDAPESDIAAAVKGIDAEVRAIIDDLRVKR